MVAAASGPRGDPCLPADPRPRGLRRRPPFQQRLRDVLGLQIGDGGGAGGLDSLLGAVVAGLILGVLESVGSDWLDPLVGAARAI